MERLSPGVSQIEHQLNQLASPAKAEVLRRFFKTGPGDYGEGDVFIGVTVPVIRMLVKQFRGVPLQEIPPLLLHPVHECRLCGFLMLVDAYQKAPSEAEKKAVFDVCVAHRKGMNNWDLVDLTTPKIIGDYLLHRDRSMLYRWVNGSDLWEQRMSVLATYAFIRKNDFKDILDIAVRLMYHKHDLIHKAVGWMLREAGKRDEAVLIGFLDAHHRIMPRTMLRYALEKIPDPLRKQYMQRH